MPSEREKMLNGERYDSMNPKLVAAREHARELTQAYNQTAPDAHEERRELLEDLLGSLGERCHFEPPFRCDYGSNIHVSEDFYANFDCVILDVCPVEIGRNCQLGPGAHIYTATHALDPSTRTDNLEHGKPVTIGDTVWIGGHAIINPGITIGDNAVVGSGAVVTDDVPSDVLVQGNPAKVVKELD